MGPLPIVNRFLERLGLEALLEKFVPTCDPRTTLPYARGLGVLLRSIVVEREPIYRQQETVAIYAPRLFGLTRRAVEKLRDDHIGRALDRLFDADRGTLLTEVVVEATRRFDIRFDELHNDSTTVRFTGQYRLARGRSMRGRRAPWITLGHSKDHRPDLKQLLYILTVSGDGGLPVQFRCEAGNKNDSTTHIQTWEALREATGKTDFLYVGDSKLCSYENMYHIDRRGGRFVTVLPRTRSEDKHFRKWIQTHEPEWHKVWDKPNPRQKYGPRDRWYTFRFPLPSQEAWPIIWVRSTLLAIHQQHRRTERLARAVEELEEIDQKLQGPRPRRRSRQEIGKKVDEILERLGVGRYLKVEIWQEETHRFRQETRGRPGPETRYRRQTRRRWRLRWSLDKEAVAYDEKSDGTYPLLTNDENLTDEQVLAAHKRQPAVEKRFEQLKSVHEIAPVLLKNEGRIEALFFLYFLALLVQALIERQIRRGMEEREIEELPIYPEERCSKRPTSQQVLRLFAQLERHELIKNERVVQVFEPKLTELQRKVLTLLRVPPRSFYAEPSGGG